MWRLLRRRSALARPWQPLEARWRSDARHRSPATYQAVIDQFEVERSARYRKGVQGRDETYCNIFVWDVTRAMAAEVPHWVDSAGECVAAGRGSETTANEAIRWLRAHGPDAGWREVDLANAQAAANLGRPAIAAWLNAEGQGHLAMVRPGVAGDEGPLLAQAGETNSGAIRAAAAFPTAWRTGAIAYFVHD